MVDPLVHDRFGTLTGTVTSTEGRPLAGLYVSIHRTAYFAITDNEGRYLLQGPLQRRYTVKYFQEWYKDERRLVLLRDGETTTVDVVLERS